MFTYEEAMAASLEYFEGDDLAANVFITKYALHDQDGNILEKTPDDMHRRMAKEFARIEKDKFEKPLTEDEIYEYFKGFKRIIPQGSVMYGCGNKYQYVTLSNCYTLPSPHDSYLGINYLDTQIAQISSRRGGVGWDMSTLRPKDMRVKNAAGSTTGTVSFMHRYSNTIREVCQSGRRGASLQSLHVKHPEIMDFITCKNDDVSITGSNISIQLYDDFMKLVETNSKDFTLQWPVDSKNPTIKHTVNPQDIWNTFIESAWNRAEPGAIFMDTVHKYSTSAQYEGFKEITCNPCAEQMMPEYSCCRLICINLYNYVKNKFTNDAYFDYDAFNNDVEIMQRLADDIVDLDIECIDRIIEKIKSDPEPKHIKQIGIDLWKEIKARSLVDRRTGCGIVGLADTLASLNIKYDSDKSISKCDELFKNFKLSAFKSSVNMAKELGPFSVYDNNKDIKSKFIQNIQEEDIKLYNRMKKYGRRNMTLLTIAPTGSVSIMTQTSSGLEPVFMLEYKRRKKINPSDTNSSIDFIDKSGDKWTEFVVLHKGVKDWKQATNKDDITKSPYYDSCAHNIDYLKKIDLQATIQKHIDNSISVTTNLPSNIDKETVSKLYFKAWKSGCKGFTIYRDGCRSGVLVNEESDTVFPEERPRELPCDVHHITSKGQKFFVLVGLCNDRPYEIFAGLNNILSANIKSGKIIKKKKNCYRAEFDNGDELSPITNAMTEVQESISRLCSLLLRNKVDMHNVVSQLEKIGEARSDIQCFSSCLARALKKYIKNGTKEKGFCPECNQNTLIRQDGCITCFSCGWSKC